MKISRFLVRLCDTTIESTFNMYRIRVAPIIRNNRIVHTLT